VSNCVCDECARIDRSTPEGKARARKSTKSFYDRRSKCPEFHQHLNELGKKYRRRDPERYAHYDHQYYEKNKDAHLKRSKQWQQDHREYAKRYYQDNKEKFAYDPDAYQNNKERMLLERKGYRERHKEQIKKRDATYRSNNTAKLTASSNKRRAAKLQRTPNWLTANDQAKIEMLYAEAQQLTEQTGIKHVVDHYYPLQGETVSGLHHPLNLQVIPELENATKKNKHPDDFYVDPQ
jgi:hypothetical protein